MKLEDQKEIALGVLNVIIGASESAIIAGGAARNWDEGKLAKDIDIYVERPSNLVDITESLLLAYPKLSITQSKDVAQYDMGLNITEIMNYKISRVDIQIMLVAQEITTDLVFDNFDTGLCKVGWSKVGRVDSREYREDRANKTITFDFEELTDAQIKSSLRHHLPKMMKYYPDYKLVLGTDKPVKRNCIPFP